jgi:hypothetical protein
LVSPYTKCCEEDLGVSAQSDTMDTLQE